MLKNKFFIYCVTTLGIIAHVVLIYNLIFFWNLGEIHYFIYILIMIIIFCYGLTLFIKELLKEYKEK